MNPKLLIIFVVFFYHGSLFSQVDFKILKIDDTQYPTIKVYLQSNNEIIDKKDFKISELNKKKDFDFKVLPYSSLKQKKAVFFVVQKQKRIDSVRKINKFIINSFDLFNKNDKLNIGLFSSKKSSTCDFFYLSAEFSKDFDFFSNNLTGNYYAKNLNNRNITFCESINSLLKFINSKDNLPDNKSVIFIIQDIKFDSEDKKCLENIKIKNIPIYFMITNISDSLSEKKLIDISDSTGGIFTNISIDKIPETYERYFNDISLRESLLNKNIYLLTFISEQNNEKNFFKITYKNKNKISYFNNANLSDENMLYKKILIILIPLLIIFVILFLYNNRKKKKYKLIINKSFKINKNNLSKVGKKSYNFIKPAVIVLKTKNITKTINVPAIGGIIGRNPDCEINIIESTVSGVHAEIKIKKGRYIINDLDSTNGTYVNGNRIDTIELNNNDLIKIGTALLKLKY